MYTGAELILVCPPPPTKAICQLPPLQVQFAVVLECAGTDMTDLSAQLYTTFRAGKHLTKYKHLFFLYCIVLHINYSNFLFITQCMLAVSFFPPCRLNRGLHM